MALLDTRNRIVGALDRELAEVRSLKNMTDVTVLTKSAQDFIEHAPLPNNVLPVGREIFTASELKPAEMTLDPSLERATIEELNAALAAAFTQMSAQ